MGWVLFAVILWYSGFAVLFVASKIWGGDRGGAAPRPRLSDRLVRVRTGGLADEAEEWLRGQ